MNSGNDEQKINSFTEVFDNIISRKTLESVERDYIIQTLEQTGWKVGGKNSAAEIFGLDRSTLRARMRKLNIQKP